MTTADAADVPHVDSAPLDLAQHLADVRLMRAGLAMLHMIVELETAPGAEPGCIDWDGVLALVQTAEAAAVRADDTADLLALQAAVERQRS